MNAQRRVKRQTESAPLSLAVLDADSNRLLKQTEVGKLLGKSLSWLERQRWARTGPRYIKIGRSVFYRAGDLLDYVRAGTVETTTQRAA